MNQPLESSARRLNLISWPTSIHSIRPPWHKQPSALLLLFFTLVTTAVTVVLLLKPQLWPGSVHTVQSRAEDLRFAFFFGGFTLFQLAALYDLRTRSAFVRDGKLFVESLLSKKEFALNEAAAWGLYQVQVHHIPVGVSWDIYDQEGKKRISLDQSIRGMESLIQVLENQLPRIEDYRKVILAKSEKQADQRALVEGRKRSSHKKVRILETISGILFVSAATIPPLLNVFLDISLSEVWLQVALLIYLGAMAGMIGINRVNDIYLFDENASKDNAGYFLLGAMFFSIGGFLGGVQFETVNLIVGGTILGCVVAAFALKGSPELPRKKYLIHFFLLAIPIIAVPVHANRYFDRSPALVKETVVTAHYESKDRTGKTRFQMTIRDPLGSKETFSLDVSQKQIDQYPVGSKIKIRIREGALRAKWSDGIAE